MCVCACVCRDLERTSREVLLRIVEAMDGAGEGPALRRRGAECRALPGGVHEQPHDWRDGAGPHRLPWALIRTPLRTLMWTLARWRAGPTYPSRMTAVVKSIKRTVVGVSVCCHRQRVSRDCNALYETAALELSHIHSHSHRTRTRHISPVPSLRAKESSPGSGWASRVSLVRGGRASRTRARVRGA